MKKEASVTVFLALSFALIAALILGIVESARTVSQRLYLQVACDSAMESLFSQFHRPLWENYRILGLEYRDDGDLAEELSGFIAPYTAAKDLFPANVSAQNISLSDQEHLTEDIFLEEEILEYMKYGMADSLIRFAGRDQDEAGLSNTLETAFTRVPESTALQELQKKYRLSTGDTEAVEDAISRIADSVQAVREMHASAAGRLLAEDPIGFYRDSAAFRSRLDQLSASVSAFRSAADALARKLEALRSDFDLQKKDLSAEGIAAVEAGLAEYEAYTAENGRVRALAEAMPSQAESLILFSSSMDDSVAAFEEWLYEAEEDAADDEDSDYDFSGEIRSFYQGAHAEWTDAVLPVFDYETHSISKKNKRILESIGNLLEGDLLPFVLPDGGPIPSAEKTNETETGFTAASGADLAETVLLGEYSLHYFNYYRDRGAPASDYPKSGSRALEIEYLLNGADSDEKNLSAFVRRLIALREGMNLLYLYQDTAKRNEARLFVITTLLGGAAAANPALLSVLTFFVLSIWALAQSFSDVKALLSGGRVPLLHTKESWTLAVSDLLTFGQTHTARPTGNETKGFSYRDYLRIFLYGEGCRSQAEINRRMLSRMEKNLRSGPAGEPQFLISQCLYGVQGSFLTDAKHILYGNGLLRKVSGRNLDPDYSFRVESFYKYRNETH